MTTVTFEGNTPQVRHLLEYIKTLPFATVVEEGKKGFEEAVAECNGRPASEFVAELRTQVKEHFHRA